MIMNDKQRKAIHAKKKKFTFKDYLANEDRNAHSENALRLTETFGTPEEINEIKKIQKSHYDRGHILDHEAKRRNEISNKYYRKLRGKQ